MSAIPNRYFVQTCKSWIAHLLAPLCLGILFLLMPLCPHQASSTPPIFSAVDAKRRDDSIPLRAQQNDIKEIGSAIEELSTAFEKTRRELHGLDLRLTEIAENKVDSQAAFNRLAHYLKNPQFSSESSYFITNSKNILKNIDDQEVTNVNVDIISLKCSEFIKSRKNIILEHLLPRTQQLLEQLEKRREEQQFALKQEVGEATPIVFWQLTESEWDLKIVYLQRQVEQLSKQAEYASALIVYEECIEQIYRYPASNTMGLQLREKIQQRLPVIKKEDQIKKQIEDWTNSTIERHGRFRQNLEELEKAFPKDHFSYQQIEQFNIEGEIERWIENNSRILHEIESDEAFLNATIERCKKLVNQYCLWMQDSLPLKFYLRKSVWGRPFHNLLLSFFTSFSEIHTTEFFFFLLLTIFLAVLVFLFLTPWIKSSGHNLNQIQEKLGKVTKDSVILTFQACFWHALRASLWPLLLSSPFASLWILAPDQNHWLSLAKAGLSTSLLSYFFILLKAMSVERGLFESHLRFPRKKLKKIFFGWHVQVVLLCGSYFSFNYFLLCPPETFNVVFARVSFIAMVMSTILFKWRLARASVPMIAWSRTLSQSNYFNFFSWLSTILIALYTAIAAAKGFFETAKIIFWCLEKFIILLGVLLFIYQLIVRVMLVHRRRISFERNLQRRTELLEQISKKGGEVDDKLLQENETIVDLETLSSRALSLLCSLTQISSLAIFWFMCPELQPMLNRLDIALIPPSITLFGALTSSIWLFLFYQFYRDLPSALDLLVFPHFKWTQNTRYTVRLLTRYAIFIVGFIFFYNQINAQANESLKMIGTLVIGALGFGIRDIFNSLISGIIILTLKTIQVGDTVNIGEITGVVTQVTILSTIVIDAEKKEFSIPNKNLINELFSRWPSDDLVNRISFKISVPSRCAPETVFKVLKGASQTIDGVAHNPDEENTSIIGISRGILTYELILLIEDLQHQAFIRTSLYEQILKCAAALGISQDEISIHS